MKKIKKLKIKNGVILNKKIIKISSHFLLLKKNKNLFD